MDMANRKKYGWGIMSLLLVLLNSSLAGQIIYVDASAAGAINGSSWSDAYVELQSALVEAEYGDEIRVAAGMYKPDYDPDIGNHTSNREATFQLESGVALYGGFPSGGGVWEERDPNENDSILSGDLGGNDIWITIAEELRNDPSRAENCYHVVNSSGTDSTTILDGFVITGGYAQNWPEHFCGSGIYNDMGNPTILNCIIHRNFSYRGGGIYCQGGGPLIRDCLLERNLSENGGGIYYQQSHAVIEGCTIRYNSAHSYGGGIFCGDQSEPTITQCILENNESRNCGGGLYSEESNPFLYQCIIRGNMSGAGGGIGLHNSQANISQSIIEDNFSYEQGGGIHAYRSDPNLTYCRISGNLVESDEEGEGGGMRISEDSHPILNSCIVNGNTALYGGGMLSTNSSTTLIDCNISGNLATAKGGGVASFHGDCLNLKNCLFSGNEAVETGGGIYAQGSYLEGNVILLNCTLFGNRAFRGKAIACDSPWQLYPIDMEMTNSIFWDGGQEIWNNNGSTINITYSDIQGGWEGEGNSDADPLFAEPGYWDDNETPGDPSDDFWVEGNCRLQSNSPCIDAGDPDYVSDPGETDLSGNPRVWDGNIDGVAIVDMGAYEFVAVEAEMKITPRSINCRSHDKWIKTHLTLSEGFVVSDLDVNAPLRMEPLGIESDSLKVFAKKDGLVEIEATFDRQKFCETVDVLTEKIVVFGSFTNGESFYGTADVRIILPGSKEIAELGVN